MMTRIEGPSTVPPIQSAAIPDSSGEQISWRFAKVKPTAALPSKCSIDLIGSTATRSLPSCRAYSVFQAGAPLWGGGASIAGGPAPRQSIAKAAEHFDPDAIAVEFGQFDSQKGAQTPITGTWFTNALFRYVNASDPLRNGIFA